MAGPKPNSEKAERTLSWALAVKGPLPVGTEWWPLGHGAALNQVRNCMFPCSPRTIRAGVVARSANLFQGASLKQ